MNGLELCLLTRQINSLQKSKIKQSPGGNIPETVSGQIEHDETRSGSKGATLDKTYLIVVEVEILEVG